MARIVEDGQVLYPVIVQDQKTLSVLMMAYANDEALALTRSTGLAHFYSRSRKALWKKGETSQHILPVGKILTDCDGDSYLYLAHPESSVCHLDRESCFGDAPHRGPDPLEMVTAIVKDRLQDGDHATSYTWELFDGPLGQIVKKFGEEAVEVVIAAMAKTLSAVSNSSQKNDVVWEISDLLYHLAVLMARLEIPLDAVADELLRRHQVVR